jgi:hypothetical protein
MESRNYCYHLHLNPLEYSNNIDIEVQRDICGHRKIITIMHR